MFWPYGNSQLVLIVVKIYQILKANNSLNLRLLLIYFVGCLDKQKKQGLNILLKITTALPSINRPGNSENTSNQDQKQQTHKKNYP